jgi:K+-sensing histidine kinase KdpD
MFTYNIIAIQWTHHKQKVVAIFKKGDTSLPSNYRPISLISCVGKLMERIVYNLVESFRKIAKDEAAKFFFF